MCVCERERESVCMCVCVRERERECIMPYYSIILLKCIFCTCKSYNLSYLILFLTHTYNSHLFCTKCLIRFKYFFITIIFFLFLLIHIYIYMYAFSRRFYPKRLKARDEFRRDIR